MEGNIDVCTHHTMKGALRWAGLLDFDGYGDREVT